MRTRPAACCRARPRPSSRSSAPIASAARWARSSAGSDSSFPRSFSSSRCRCCSSGTPRRSGCAAPAPARAPPSRPSPSTRALALLKPELRARAQRPRAAGSLGRLPRRRGRSRRAHRALSRARPARLRPHRARAAGPPFRHRRAALDAARGADAEGRRGGRARSAVLDRVQGRRPLLRRRLRDHPADAGRRGRQVPLDDQCRVPQCRRARPGHARPGRRDDRRGGVCRARDRRWPARRGGRLRAVLLVHPARRRALPAAAREPSGARASSTVRARPRSARSSAPRSR